MLRSSLLVRAFVVPILWLVGIAVARAEHALALTELSATTLKIDGDLGDFRGVRFVELGDDADGSLEYALGYDAQALYVAARVYDDDFVRSSEPSPGEDALVLSLAMPRASGQPLLSEVWLFAGIPGKQAGRAAISAPGQRPITTRDVTVVEGPLAGHAGYVLEAKLPWAAVPGGREALVGRGALRMVDVDGKPGAAPHVVASSSAARASSLLPLLMSGGPNASVQAFLAAKQLAPGSVRFDLIGQVAGDARLDRVVLAGTFLVVAGPGLEQRGGYHFMDLPVSSSAGVLHAELRELTGDDLSELVLRLRREDELGQHEQLQVIALAQGQPRPLLSIDLLPQAQGASPDARVRFERGQPAIVDVQSEQGRRSYQWDGSTFAVVREEPSAKPARAARSPHESGNVATAATPAADEPERVVHREPPGMDALVAAFREAQGIDSTQHARFVQHANVAEDARIESLMLFDKYLLVIGDGYRDGSGYFYYGLPVQQGADIQRLFTADVTGDGRRELFVRHKQLIGDVRREILLVYTFTESGMEPIAQVEVRRAQGEDSVGNLVDIVPSGRCWALRIAPGAAHGWSASSYPFVADATDGYAPLLLPWKDRAQLFRFEQGRLSAHPLR